MTIKIFPTFLILLLTVGHVFSDDPSSDEESSEENQTPRGKKTSRPSKKTTQEKKDLDKTFFSFPSVHTSSYSNAMSHPITEQANHFAPLISSLSHQNRQTETSNSQSVISVNESNQNLKESKKDAEVKNNPFQLLPVDIITLIYKNLNNKDQSSLSMTCKLLNSNFKYVDVLFIRNKELSQYFEILLSSRSHVLQILDLQLIKKSSQSITLQGKCKIQDIKLKYLKQLILFNVRDIELIAQLLKSICSDHRSNLLKLIMTWNEIKKEELEGLFQTISSCFFPNLIELDLSKNKIGESEMGLLAHAIKAGQFPNLSCLRLMGNNIRDAGAKALAQTIYAGHLPNLVHLDVSMNELSEEGVKAIVEEILSGHLPHLSYLCINLNTVESNRMYEFYQIIKAKNIKNLKCLIMLNF